MDYFNAFWVGGLICALVQILLDKTKLLPGRVMVILVCSGVILSVKKRRFFHIQAERFHRTSSGTDRRTGKREKQNAKQRKRNRSMGKRNTG